MKASVIIPTKNPGKNFCNVLETVMKQKTPWNYEILIIDSGSSDGTIEYVKSKKNIQLHEIPSNEFGHGKTRNLGISLTNGEYVVMLTHDALPADENWLLELVSAVEKDENIAGAFGRHIAYPHHGPFLERDLQLHFDNFFKGPNVVRMEDQERYQRDQGYRQLLHFFSDNNACLRRSVWEKIPYPDVDFAEDQLWAKQIIEAGYAKAYVHNAAVYHSHTFGFIEWGRRAFDEARALNHLFGYCMCPTIMHMLVQAVRTTARDTHYLIRKGMLISNLNWLLKAPLSNFFRQLGFFLGQRAMRLPHFLVSIISRDISMQRG